MALVGALLGALPGTPDLVPHAADAMNKNCNVATLWQRSAYGLTTLADTVENWLKNHHQHQDAAHDVCHFAASGLRHRSWRQMTMSICCDFNRLLFSRYCEPGEKSSTRQHSSILAAEETRRLLREEFCNFRRRKSRPFVMPLPLTVSRANRPLNNGS